MINIGNAEAVLSNEHGVTDRVTEGDNPHEYRKRVSRVILLPHDLYHEIETEWRVGRADRRIIWDGVMQQLDTHGNALWIYPVSRTRVERKYRSLFWTDLDYADPLNSYGVAFKAWDTAVKLVEIEPNNIGGE